jgi:hypothetical protein
MSGWDGTVGPGRGPEEDGGLRVLPPQSWGGVVGGAGFRDSQVVFLDFQFSGRSESISVFFMPGMRVRTSVRYS